MSNNLYATSATVYKYICRTQNFAAAQSVAKL